MLKWYQVTAKYDAVEFPGTEQPPSKWYLPSSESFKIEEVDCNGQLFVLTLPDYNLNIFTYAKIKKLATKYYLKLITMIMLVPCNA